jgi:hypothetical protein
MSTDEDKKQEAEWQALHDLITATMDEFGLKDPVRKGDYWLLDENLGPLRQEVEVQNLSLLQPHVIRSLQGLLAKYRQWHICSG